MIFEVNEAKANISKLCPKGVRHHSAEFPAQCGFALSADTVEDEQLRAVRRDLIEQSPEQLPLVVAVNEDSVGLNPVGVGCYRPGHRSHLRAAS